HAFCETHVRGAKPIDFDQYLRLIGMRARVSWTPALGRDGRPTADLRLYAWQPPAERALSLVITNPAGAWGRAGLHTGDRLAALNGVAVGTVADFRSIVTRLRIGDATAVDVARPTRGGRRAGVGAGYGRAGGRGAVR